MTDLTHLDRLEAEAIQILRDGVAQADRPVLLFSGGKDSTVLAHLALEAFHPSRPPMPLLHVDSTWEFREVVIMLGLIESHLNAIGRIRNCASISSVFQMKTKDATEARESGKHC